VVPRKGARRGEDVCVDLGFVVADMMRRDRTVREVNWLVESHDSTSMTE
jgi:hypothetical protein